MRRALILATPLALVLALGACGDDDDDDSPGDTATESTKPDTTESADDAITIPDISLPDITIPDISLPDVTLPDISLPDISLPDISIPDLDELEDQFRETLEQTGLEDAQIDCLLEQLDISSGDIPDLSELTGLFEECDISLTDLGG